MRFESHEDLDLQAIHNSQFSILNSRFLILKATLSRFAEQVASLKAAFDSISDRRVILFGGKGGVGKTTIASLAAVHFAESRSVTLFSTDPASNLTDLFGKSAVRNLTLEAVDAVDLYDKFLDANLEAFLELGDRGTYLDREEIARFFELSIPGVDELMAWLRVGELAEQDDRLLIVDTAPTGHTLRMLSSSQHFRQLEQALASMQAKHTDLVQQLARRSVRDAMDDFLTALSTRMSRYRSLLTDAARTVFVPVFLAEPLVVAQTRQLIREVRAQNIEVPFAILNQAPHDCDCPRCRAPAVADVSVVSVESVEAVHAPRSCVQLHSVERLEAYLAGRDERNPVPLSPAGRGVRGEGGRGEGLKLGGARLVFFAGKGGVGKTTAASSVALQLAARSPSAKFKLISVDPAHSIRDLFVGQEPPQNLSMEIIDTRAKWNRLRETLGEEIDAAFAALTPKGVSVVHDADVMQQLIDIAPPGADELFAIMRLADLLQDEQQLILVDTAPTGHFLRLLELPATAGEWVREFMRLLLKYKEIIPPGSLGEQLVQASRALKSFDQALRSDDCVTVVVTRPDRIVIEETRRLLDTLRDREMRIGGVIANYLTPQSDCSCDESRRAEEQEILSALGFPAVPVQRVPSPPTRLHDLRSLIPLRQDAHAE